jgi:hypothetical protein
LDLVKHREQHWAVPPKGQLWEPAALQIQAKKNDAGDVDHVMFFHTPKNDTAFLINTVMSMGMLSFEGCCT